MAKLCVVCANAPPQAPGLFLCVECSDKMFASGADTWSPWLMLAWAARRARAAERARAKAHLTKVLDKANARWRRMLMQAKARKENK